LKLTPHIKKVRIAPLFPAILLIAMAQILVACTTLGLSSEDNPKLALGKGILAGPLGEGLDDVSMRKAIAAELKALSDNTPGKPVNWKSIKNREGTVVAGPAFEISSSVCKRYSHEIRIGGRTSSADGTACRNDDGVWLPLE